MNMSDQDNLDDEVRSEATFSFKVENLSKLTDSVLSQVYYQSFFLQYNGESDTANWSCSESAELRLLSAIPNRDPFVR
ncbi:hypothetical protein pipiens_010971 [Culex pipiens pipiens]|uniref:Uncharacterized protein n=1 Tax=Culex pipiens pipiens TaxID=38569 RepID=A0ABD1D8N5_CULPP